MSERVTRSWRDIPRSDLDLIRGHYRYLSPENEERAVKEYKDFLHKGGCYHVYKIKGQIRIEVVSLGTEIPEGESGWVKVDGIVGSNPANGDNMKNDGNHRHPKGYSNSGKHRGGQRSVNRGPRLRAFLNMSDNEKTRHE